MRINWISPLNFNTSYGSSALNIVTALTELGHEVSLFPIGQVQLDEKCPWTHKPIIEGLERGKLSYSVNAPCIRFFHQFSQSEFVGHGPHLAWPIFELDKFTNIEIAQLSKVDGIISCSSWSDRIVRSEILDKEYEKAVQSNFRGGRDINSYVVPLGVDSRVFNDVYNHPNHQNELNRKTTTFLHIGKTEIRKSSREIVESFKVAFKPEDDVKLLLAWHNIFNSKEEQVEWDRFAKSGTIGDKVEVLPRFSSCVEVSDVIKLRADCVVSMSKAEGWNLGNLEGMACGKQVITTINSAQSEFCDYQNCLVIETPESQPAFDNKWFLGKDFPGEKGSWAKIGENEKSQLIRHLQNVHESKENGTLQLNLSGFQTAQQFSWANSAKRLIEVLESF